MYLFIHWNCKVETKNKQNIKEDMYSFSRLLG